MNAPDSVTNWIRQLEAGERAAVQKLWERYYPQLIEVARRQLRAVPRRATDEEDVALHAFDSFCRAVEAGRYPDLRDRHGLWPALLSITINKAIDVIKHAERAKRSWKRTVIASDYPADTSSQIANFAAKLRSGEPDPAMAAEVSDHLDWLLERLEDDQLRQIAVLKLEGHTNPEIAKQLGCALSTVERRLRLIRKRLESLMDPQQGGERNPPASDSASP